MKPVEEMFLKAAGFRMIEKPLAGNCDMTMIGYRMRIKGKDYGNFIWIAGPISENVRREATDLFKEEALEVCTMLVGCHA